MRSNSVRRLLLHEICLNIVFACLIGMLVLVTALFLVSRAYIFQHELNILKTERQNEAWLRQQCEDDTFYHEMKHHSALCDEVHLRKGDNIYLMALGRVSSKTYLCGDVSCTEIVQYWIDWFLNQGFIFVVFLSIIVFAMPTITMSCWHLFGRQVSAFSRRNESIWYEPMYFSKKEV